MVLNHRAPFVHMFAQNLSVWAVPDGQDQGDTSQHYAFGRKWYCSCNEPHGSCLHDLRRLFVNELGFLTDANDSRQAVSRAKSEGVLVGVQ